MTSKAKDNLIFIFIMVICSLAIYICKLHSEIKVKNQELKLAEKTINDCDKECQKYFDDYMKLMRVHIKTMYPYHK